MTARFGKVSADDLVAMKHVGVTPAWLDAMKAQGITNELVTLHVGAGTFLPVKVERTEDHHMHTEWGEITPATAERLTSARRAGRRLVAVGTTALRLLETAADADGTIRPFRGETGIFITPDYRFRAVDVLMTNFHLPRSTLFMLVAAFSGLGTMKAAYTHAIAQRYRLRLASNQPIRPVPAITLRPAGGMPMIATERARSRSSASAAVGFVGDAMDAR